MTCREREDDLHLYALDALEGGERTELERHLRSGCPVCLGVLAEARATAASLAHTVTPVSPSPDVKRRLMAEVTRRPAAKPARWIWPALAATAAAAAAATFFFFAQPAQQERNRTRLALALAETRVRQLEMENARAARTLRLLRLPGIEMASLAGQGPSPGAHGSLLQDRSSGTWHLLVAELPVLSPGRTYQAWLIPPGGKPLPAGTFDVDARGEAEVVLQRPPGVTVATVAVTDEPAGGVEQPTGQIHLVGIPRS